MQVNPLFSTGLHGLDQALKGLIPGDNVVWQVDEAEWYAPFVPPFKQAAIARGRQIVYFRFARHRPLLQAESGVIIHQLDPSAGFEPFIENIHAIIAERRDAAWYVFDCLSDLAADWYSDTMLGNFFMLVCPYFYDLGSIAYFSLLRDRHSFRATTPISDTTQIILDVYYHKEKYYVRPVKALQRHSSTMHLLHLWEGSEFRPVTQSATVSEILNASPCLQMESSQYRMGVWQREFSHAEQQRKAFKEGRCPQEDIDAIFERLLRMAFSRDERILALARIYLTLPDLLHIAKRIIGSGLIGGKAVGMLLARAILEKSDRKWTRMIEPHDSFYIGADVYYTYLVTNGIWRNWHRLRDPDALLENAALARQRILMGAFPEYIETQFRHLLEYFGQSPIVVRSSSLMEDNFQNAFTGKYASIFLLNQGFREQRLQDFLAAIRTIYASTLSEEALRYRQRRGILGQEEQMAVLVQRVSGSMHEHFYFPHVAGVGLSFNPYVWHPRIDPQAGVLRMVFGLGTRAVDRPDDDYTRIVALNAPEIRPEGDDTQIRKHTQRNVDVLDLRSNQLTDIPFERAQEVCPDAPLHLFSVPDEALARELRDRGRPQTHHALLTFKRLFRQTDFADNTREMLQTLQNVYETPVDVEFTANFEDDGAYRINLVQCRPFALKGVHALAAPPKDIPVNEILFRTRTGIVGQSRDCMVERMIYVVPALYGQLRLEDRYAVARMIGKVLKEGEARAGRGSTILLGPGRWGTSTPSLGVPVTFNEISQAEVICEISEMHEDLTPDISLGTHFFNDIVEHDMLYLSLDPANRNTSLNRELLHRLSDAPKESTHSPAAWSQVIHVITRNDLREGYDLHLHADTIRQDAICYFQKNRN